MRREQVLERLALLDPQELIEEAKVEVCRATRDLRSCGRPVHHVLTGCGHACLCAECRKRCDYCPICRTPVSNKSVPDQLRLYELCVEAGLVVQHDDDNDEHHHHHPADVQTVSPPDDVRRLRAFFDVALDNNLVALVCHYVTDVCMDEGAISSSALVSMLLDGSVVKEWCKHTGLSISSGLGRICILLFHVEVCVYHYMLL
jgi:E3 ubiquitin-protein ligase HOS1